MVQARYSLIVDGEKVGDYPTHAGALHAKLTGMLIHGAQRWGEATVKAVWTDQTGREFGPPTAIGQDAEAALVDAVRNPPDPYIRDAEGHPVCLLLREIKVDGTITLTVEVLGGPKNIPSAAHILVARAEEFVANVPRDIAALGMRISLIATVKR